MSTEEPRRPEGRLIRKARQRAALSISAAAARTAGDDRPPLGPDQWANNERGYSSKAKERDVVPPAWTLARMAEAVGVTPGELEKAGRDDAAAELRKNTEARPALSVVPDELTDSVIDAFIAAVPEEHHRQVLWWRWRETDAETNLKPRDERLRALVDWVENYMPRPEGVPSSAEARGNSSGKVS